MKTLLSAIVLALLLLTAPAVYACSCGSYPTVCEAYQRADAVFIGVVQRAITKTVKLQDGKEYPVGQVAHIQIEKSFKGVAQPEVVFRTEGSSCDTFYEEGQRRLFYAYYNRETKSWGVPPCGRSRTIDRAADDLLYLQGLPKSASTTRLSGELGHSEDDPEKGFSRVKTISGAKVKITGEGKTYDAFTDKDGIFEIYGLPPGKYSVEPEIPVGLKVRFPIYYGETDFSDRKKTKLVLKDKSCASVSYVLSANNRIAGRVFGSDGRALSNVRLDLMPKDKAPARHWMNSDRTDKEGRYELKEIPSGEYLIVLNIEGKISSDQPFPTAYFPGVFEKDKATVLTIAPSTNLEDYDIHIPSQQNLRTLQGVLHFSDGKPAANKFVEFTANEVKQGIYGGARTATDDQGRFTLTVLEGLKGSLRGLMFTYKGQYVDCPQLDKLLSASGDRLPDLETKRMPLEITSDMQDIKLTFPFPYCKKAKEDQ